MITFKEYLKESEQIDELIKANVTKRNPNGPDVQTIGADIKDDDRANRAEKVRKMSVKHLSARGNEGDKAHKGSASVDSENKVQGIMKHIRRGGKVPPPIVDHEGTVIDGHHRVEASKRLGHKHMKVRQLPKALVKTSMATESVAHLMEDDYD